MRAAVKFSYPFRERAAYSEAMAQHDAPAPAPSRHYRRRIREAIHLAPERLSSTQIAHEFLAGSVAGMQVLQQQLPAESFDAVVDLLAAARTIWLVGMRRSFPVAAYLAYALQHTDKCIQMLHGIGAMHEGQLRSVRAGDVMLVVSFTPYAEQSVLAAQMARECGAHVIAITDGAGSPVAVEAERTLLVCESATFGFRSLTSTMGLAHSLFIALAYKLELDLAP